MGISKLLLVLMIMVAACAFFILTIPSDISPVDTRDFIRPTENIPEKQNAFTFYMKAVDAISYPQDIGKFNNHIDETDWDEDFVEGVINSNSLVYAYVEDGNHHARCIVPQVTTHDEATESANKWRSLYKLFVVKLNYDIRRGETGNALSDLKNFLEFSSRVQTDAGYYIQYLTSLAIGHWCLSVARDLVWSGLLDDNQLAQLQLIITSNPPSSTGYVLALKGEFEMSAHLVDDIYAGDRVLVEKREPWYLPNWVQRIVGKLYVHPNRIKRDMVLIYSELISQATNNYAESQLTDIEEFIANRRSEFDSADGMKTLRVPNSMGVILLSHAVLPARKAFRLNLNAQVDHAAMTVMAAVHRFRKANGVLPRKLCDLVPEFLPAVPADPYDGKQIRYSSSSGIIYSVGEDLADSGGSTNRLPELRPALSAHWQTEDLVFPIEKETTPEKSFPSES